MLILPPDVEKRDNPVCHFVTPLDGKVDSDIQRPAEVSERRVAAAANICTPPPPTLPHAVLCRVASAGYRESVLEDQDQNSHTRIPQVENVLQETGTLFK